MFVVRYKLIVSEFNRRALFGCAAERIPQTPKPLESPQALAFQYRAPHNTTVFGGSLGAGVCEERSRSMRDRESVSILLQYDNT